MRCLQKEGRAQYVSITDEEAVNAFEYLFPHRGNHSGDRVLTPLPTAMKLAPTMDKDKIIVITISGRGDKDVAAIARYRGSGYL